MDYLPIPLTLLAAALGALIFVKLKIPAGAFLGAMFFVALFNVFTDMAYFPAEARPYIRILAGALIGSRMKKSDIYGMKAVIFPAFIIVLGMLILNLALGYGINRLTGLELTTALLGSAPGGIQDMALIAEDLGADAAQIAVLQTIRLLAVLSVFPVFLKAFSRRHNKRSKGTVHPLHHDEADEPSPCFFYYAFC